MDLRRRSVSAQGLINSYLDPLTIRSAGRWDVIVDDAVAAVAWTLAPARLTAGGDAPAWLARARSTSNVIRERAMRAYAVPDLTLSGIRVPWCLERTRRTAAMSPRPPPPRKPRPAAILPIVCRYRLDYAAGKSVCAVHDPLTR